MDAHESAYVIGFAVLLIGVVVGSLLVLTGCSNAADPSKIKWTEIESQSIVSLSSTQSVFIQGSLYSTEGGSQVDYRFAQKLPSGAIREDLVSSTMERLIGKEVEYKDAYVIDVYEDATADAAMLTVLQCEQPDSKGSEKDPNPISFDGLFGYYPCVTEDGRAASYRVELHVPAGTVASEFDSGEQIPAVPEG